MSGKRDKLATARLYGIADLGYLEESALEESVAALLEGGVDLLQLRAKNHRANRIKSFAERILPLCRAAGVPLIINDFAGLVSEVGADGAHLGQDDGDLARARRGMGPGAGTSNSPSWPTLSDRPAEVTVSTSAGKTRVPPVCRRS